MRERKEERDAVYKCEKRGLFLPHAPFFQLSAAFGCFFWSLKLSISSYFLCASCHLRRSSVCALYAFPSSFLPSSSPSVSSSSPSPPSPSKHAQRLQAISASTSIDLNSLKLPPHQPAVLLSFLPLSLVQDPPDSSQPGLSQPPHNLTMPSSSVEVSSLPPFPRCARLIIPPLGPGGYVCAIKAAQLGLRVRSFLACFYKLKF